MAMNMFDGTGDGYGWFYDFAGPNSWPSHSLIHPSYCWDMSWHWKVPHAHLDWGDPNDDVGDMGRG